MSLTVAVQWSAERLAAALEAAGEEQPINNTEVCSDSHCLSLRSINRLADRPVAAQPCVLNLQILRRADTLTASDQSIRGNILS